MRSISSTMQSHCSTAAVEIAAVCRELDAIRAHNETKAVVAQPETSATPSSKPFATANPSLACQSLNVTATAVPAPTCVSTSAVRPSGTTKSSSPT